MKDVQLSNQPVIRERQMSYSTGENVNYTQQLSKINKELDKIMILKNKAATVKSDIMIQKSLQYRLKRNSQLPGEFDLDKSRQEPETNYQDENMNRYEKVNGKKMNPQRER